MPNTETVAQTTEPPKPRPRYTCTLSGSQWDFAYYGIVEFLRVHPVSRVTVGVIAFLSLMFLVADSIFTIPGVPKGSWFVLLFITPTLFWIATVSGSSFELVFPTAKASAERQVAEQKFEKTQAPEDALNLDFKRLSEYYAINQQQARSSFRWAKFSMLGGFATIVVGIWLFYFRPTQPDKFMSTLSAATGCIINIVAGLFLRLHSQTQDRALHYFEPLARLQRLSLAMRLVDAHQEPTEQTLSRNTVIRELLQQSRNV